MANATKRQPSATKIDVIDSASAARSANDLPKIINLKLYDWSKEKLGTIARSGDDYIFTTLDQPPQVFHCALTQIESAWHLKT